MFLECRKIPVAGGPTGRPAATTDTQARNEGWQEKADEDKIKLAKVVAGMGHLSTIAFLIVTLYHSCGKDIGEGRIRLEGWSKAIVDSPVIITG